VLNLPHLQRHGGSGGGRQRIGDLGVLAGHVDVELRGTPLGTVQVVLDDTNVDVSFDEDGSPDARLLITGGSVTQGVHRYPIELIQARVLVTDGRAELRHVRAEVGDVRLAVPRARIGTAAPFDVDAEGEAWAPLELLREFSPTLRAPLLQGGAHASLRVQRTGGQLEADGRVEVRGLVIGPEMRAGGHTLGPHAIGDVTADVRYLPGEVAVSELVVDRLAEGDGRILAHNLTVGLTGDLPIEADVVFEDTELAWILIDAGLYASRVRLKVSGTSTLSGRLRGFRLRCFPTELSTRDFEVLTANTFKDDAQRILAMDAATVRGRVVIDGEAVRLRNMAVTFGRTALSVQANFGLRQPRTWSLHASTQGGAELWPEDVGTISGLFFGGHGQVDVNIAGTYGDPTVRGELDMDDFQIASIPFGSVQGSLIYRRFVITLPEVNAQRNESRYRFSDATVRFGGGVRLEGLATFEPLHLADAVSMFGLTGQFERAQGVATGQAQVRYTSRANRWQVDVDTALSETSFAGVPLGGGEALVNYDRGDIAIDRVSLTRGQASTSVRGTVGRDGALGLDVELSGLQLQTIDQLPAALHGLQGTARGRAHLSGTVQYPRGSGWVDLSPVTYRSSRLGPSRVQFDVDGQELRLTGGLAGRLVDLEELRLTLQAPYPLWVRATVHGLDLATVLGADALPSGLDVRVEGSIDAGLDLGRLGDARRPTRRRDLGLSGWARIDSVTLIYQAFTIFNAEPVEVSFERDRANVRASPFELLSIAMNNRGTFELGGWASLDAMGLELRGRDLDLAFVPEMIDSVDELSGTANVDCQIGGTYGEPDLLGTASFQLDRLRLAGGLRDYPAEQLSGRVRFSRNAVLLEGLRARILGGQAAGSGRVTLDGLSLGSYRLDATVHDARLALGPGSSAVLNGTINLTSPAAEGALPTVGGQIEVVRLRYTEPTELLNIDIDELARRRRTEVSTYDPAGDSIRLNLRLMGQSNLRIENNLVDASLVIDDQSRPFSLVGTNQVQSFLGIVRIEQRGTVTFRNTEFEIERGFLEFNDPFEFDPSVDFLATATRRDWVITLQIGGTYHEPTITLTSDPPLSDADIALLLTVGLTRDETEQLGYGSATTSALPELLWNLTGVDEEVSRLVPMLDELRLTTDYSERTGRAEPRVRMGRRIRDNLRIGASAGLAESRDIEANLEWQLRDDLSLELLYENDTGFDLGNIGGDLRWHLEF
jgi:translocation and assembly module TamB